MSRAHSTAEAHSRAEVRRGAQDDECPAAPAQAVDASPERARVRGLLALFVALLLFELPGARLIDRDESRYAEIPRAMRASGDFVTPTLNGSHYFEKPPLHYWLVAGAQELFGESPFAARLPVRLATLGTAALLWFGGGALLGAGAGPWAALIFLSAPLDFVLGRQNLIDPVLLFFLTWAFLALYRFLSAPAGIAPARRRRVLIEVGVATGLAMLAKGLVAVVLPGLVFLAWVALMGAWRRVRELLVSPAPLAFLVVAVPWFVLVERANPGFASFFFVHEHFQRFATEDAGRVQPVYFFGLVFVLGFLPWTLFLGRPLRALGPLRLTSLRPSSLRQRPQDLYLVLWLGIVLGFFSISQSKLMPYLLPGMPAAAALLARAFARQATALRGPLLVHAALWTLLVPIGIFLGLRQGQLVDAGLLWPVIGAGALLLGLVWAAPFAERRGPRRGLPYALGGWAPLFLCAALAQPAIGATKSSERLLSETVQPGDELVQYRLFRASAPLTLGRPVPVVGTRSELASDGLCSPALFWSEEDFWARWDSAERLTVLLRRSDRPRFERPSGNPPVTLGSAGRYLVLSNLPVLVRQP